MSGEASAPLLGTKGLSAPERDRQYGAIQPPTRQQMNSYADVRPEHVPLISTDGRCFVCTTPLASFLGLICCPLTVCGLPHVIPVRHEAVATVFGQYIGTFRDSGVIFVNPCGLRMHHVSVNNRAQELAAIKVADSQGNSLIVSGIVTYRVINCAKAALDMENLEVYVRIQAHAVLKRVASRFPYVTYDGTPSLITEQASLGGELRQLLQEKVELAGVHVVAYELSDLAYAAEIAPLMLVRQQAQAIVDARRTIVHGAVNITSDAIQGLTDRGHAMAEGDKPKLITNLLTVICSEKSPVPTIDM